MPAIQTGTWYGYNVFMTRPNWASPPSLRLDHSLLRFNDIYPRGLYYSNQTSNTPFLSFEYLLEEREYIKDFRDFFDDRLGRLEGFWVPTWRSDLVASAVFDASDTQISIEDYGYADFYFPNEFEGRHVCLLWPDGTYAFRKIISATNSEITLSSQAGKALETAELGRFKISFLYFVRFNADEVKLKFKNSSVAIASVTFKSLFISNEIEATITQTTSSTSSTISTTSTTLSTTCSTTSTTRSTTTTTTA